MRIGIDARLWSQSGVGRYIRNLVFNLQKLDTKNEYYIFLAHPEYYRLDYHNKKFHKVLANFKWYGVSEQIKFPILLNKYKLDLVHFPHFNVPILYRGKFVVTIHDLIHEHFQMRRATTLNPLVYKLKQWGYKKVFNSALKKSQKVIVPSNFVKQQIINKWDVNQDKIAVTYEGVEEQLIAAATCCTESEIGKALKKYQIKPPFIFYVGNAHPHKNVEGLIKTFLNLRNNYQYLQLVLSGSDHYFWERIKKEFKQKDIIYTGYIDDKDLICLYKSAKCFVMPSFEEGFGIPLLEAMACKCPVVSSDKGSLPEIGGNAALYFDPLLPRHSESLGFARDKLREESSDMEQKIMDVLNSETVRSELIKKGQKRYKQFNWKDLAGKTLKIYASN